MRNKCPKARMKEDFVYVLRSPSVTFPRCALTPHFVLRSGHITSEYEVRFVALAHPNLSLRSGLRISTSRNAQSASG